MNSSSAAMETATTYDDSGSAMLTTDHAAGYRESLSNRRPQRFRKEDIPMSLLTYLRNGSEHRELVALLDLCLTHDHRVDDLEQNSDCDGQHRTADDSDHDVLER